ncbi:ABC transporter, ATP-binding protein [Methylophaga frappieri]|uniref:ABC transporter, ATP-binding protein n=1 Tax=Methylophaga frappieri (strain ATCC BAA-2434 / DSM 25690 / JAM7) TaxID=754477 RepID=I1YI64_METFJ|nr:ATP-binding cassette domain-containing protein [Methylophaga frappieri]AFJ02607.1 ABC transporter, ATP-binding protein [Methylophaga frappieri]
MTQAIEIADLVKHFGEIRAVDGINLNLSRGEVLGFLGPNGAGKSTTMKMITGFLSPTRGRVSVCGHDVQQASIPAKASIGYLPEGAPAYADMTPASFLSFIADIRGFSGKAKRDAVAVAAERARVVEVMFQPIETLSKGYKRRVGLAQAILHNPPILIMDEPTDGLDPNQKHEVRTLINEMAHDKAIIISTHILEEVHALCTRNVLISRGKIEFDGTPHELESLSRYHNAVVMTISGTHTTALTDFVTALPFVDSYEVLGDLTLRVFPLNHQQITLPLSEKIREKGWDIVSLYSESGRLDEVFRQITTRASMEIN